MRGPTALLLSASVGLMLCLAASDLMAQNNQNQNGGRQRQGNGQAGGRQRRNNVDPAQIQQRMMDRYRERLEITDDAEWKTIQPLIQKVVDARMAVAAGGRGMFGRGGRPGEDANQQGQTDQGQRRTTAPTNPAAEVLQKAVDAKAPAAEMKGALAKYLEYRKGKQAELEQAQTALRAVLTSRQEAIAVLSGLL